MTTSPGRPPDERAEELLRAALEGRAALVEIAPDALSTIRARTAKRAWWHRFRGGAMPLAFTTGAATAVAATVTAVIFTAGSCAPPGPATPSTPAGASSTTPGGQTPSSNPSTTTSNQSANVPVYFIGSIKGIPRLYREFHVLPVGDGSKAALAKAAVTEMLDGRNAYDHDYISSWPAGAAVRGVQVSGDTVTVDLSGASINAYDPPTEKAALQQLIYTATAASGATTMKLLLDGQPVAKLWNLLPASGSLGRGPMVDYFAPVWIIDPQANASVGGTVTVFAAGIVFEAQIRVRIRTAGNQIVFDQGLLLNNGPPSQGTGTLKVTGLAPGTYTVEGFYFSAADGSIQGMDNHIFTVK